MIDDVMTSLSPVPRELVDALAPSDAIALVLGRVTRRAFRLARLAPLDAERVGEVEDAEDEGGVVPVDAAPAPTGPRPGAPPRRPLPRRARRGRL